MSCTHLCNLKRLYGVGLVFTGRINAKGSARDAAESFFKKS